MYVKEHEDKWFPPISSWVALSRSSLSLVVTLLLSLLLVLSLLLLWITISIIMMFIITISISSISINVSISISTTKSPACPFRDDIPARTNSHGSCFRLMFGTYVLD